MLLRSGVGKLRLIDFDQVGSEKQPMRDTKPRPVSKCTPCFEPSPRASPSAHLFGSPSIIAAFASTRQVTLSSLNRHAVATRADVGLPKATVLKRHFEDVMPDAQVEACVRMYEEARSYFNRRQQSCVSFLNVLLRTHSAPCITAARPILLCVQMLLQHGYPYSEVGCLSPLGCPSTQAAEEELLGGNPDLVIDCIDNIDTKARETDSASLLE